MAEILVAASTEMAEAAAWYDGRVAGLGERFLHEAEVAFARIDEKPLTGPPWKHRRLPDGVRRMFVRSFPYAAVYILEPRVVVVDAGSLSQIRRSGHAPPVVVLQALSGAFRSS